MMTPEEAAQRFEAKLQQLLIEFQAETGYSAMPRAALTPVLGAVLQAAGAPIDGWKIEVGWRFIPVPQFEKPPTT